MQSPVRSVQVPGQAVVERRCARAHPACHLDVGILEPLTQPGIDIRVLSAEPLEAFIEQVGKSMTEGIAQQGFEVATLQHALKAQPDHLRFAGKDQSGRPGRDTGRPWRARASLAITLVTQVHADQRL
ncbi:hypothetical protein D3C76_1205610 [compost metagenome]